MLKIIKFFTYNMNTVRDFAIPTKRYDYKDSLSNCIKLYGFNRFTTLSIIGYNTRQNQIKLQTKTSTP